MVAPVTSTVADPSPGPQPLTATLPVASAAERRAHLLPFAALGLVLVLPPLR